MSNADKKFKEAYETIKAPADLKTETLSLMFEEDARIQETQEEVMLKRQEEAKEKHDVKKQRPVIVRYGAVFLTACAAILCFVIFMPRGASYVTPMEDGVYYDTVELKDGEIHFMQNRMAISITPNAGLAIGSIAEEAERKEDVLLIEETTKSGGELRFLQTGGVTLPAMSQSGWSNIGEQEIYVTVLKAEEVRYQAVYEKEGITYEVIGTDVSQREFIDFLYDQIK